MTDVIAVLCSCHDREEALRIARAVVEARLAACANILPQMESIYRWQEKIETAEEYLLLMKTTAAKFKALRDEVVRLHSYDTPEVLALPIKAGLENYLNWLRESV